MQVVSSYPGGRQDVDVKSSAVCDVAGCEKARPNVMSVGHHHMPPDNDDRQKLTPVD